MPTYFGSEATRLSNISRLLLVLAVVLGICSAATAQQGFGIGTIKTFTIKSTVLGEDRIVLVRTPVGYEANKARYPVLYMTDGDAHMGHTSSTVDFLTGNGRISDLIVVGVTNTDRTRDLTPVKSTQKNAAGELVFPTSGGSDNFLKFFETELIPEIEKEFRVQPYRILAGHSLGGLFVIHTILRNPHCSTLMSRLARHCNGRTVKRSSALKSS